MIGIGTWSCRVDTMFFKGNATVKIIDNNGEYGIELEVPGVDIPDVTIKEIHEDGNSLNAIAQTSLLPGKDIEMSIDFDGDDFGGFLKIPFLGKVKLKDGHRVA